MEFISKNPFTQEILAEFDTLSHSQITDALDQADNGFVDWSQKTIHQRAEVIAQVGHILSARKKELAQLIVAEMGKPIQEALAEIEKCAACCKFYAEKSDVLLRESVIITEASKSYVHYQPLGVILAIMPWNFPFWQVFRFACPTMMAGNAVILKHAPNVPQCAQKIEEIFTQALCSAGAFQSLYIDTDIIPDLIAQPQIKGVTLTGSGRAGAAVAAVAGKNLKKTVLELGGSDAFVVIEDADLDLAAQQAARSRMLNNGQSCIAAKRFILVEEVAEEFQEKFLKALQQFRYGDPTDPNTQYSVLARPDLATQLAKQVQGSVDEGVHILWQAERPTDNPCYFPPTILTQVRADAPAYREELFGPVATILIAENYYEAIQMANDTNFGLGASLWTKNLAQAEHLAKELQAGSVFVNEIVKSDPRLPFGGIKNSGFGRELSTFGLHEFTNVQSIWIG